VEKVSTTIRKNDKEYFMELQNVLYEVKNKIAYVTINRPKVLNALNRQTIEELRDVFLDIRHKSDALAVILTGAGEKSFVAGADINELATQTPLEGKDTSRRGQHVLDLIEGLGKPVLAAINGFALGGGCELSMACHVRFASDNAKLGQPEVKLGLVAGYGGTQRLVRLVGLGRALELLLSGEQIPAQRACEMGLVNRVYPQADLLKESEAYLQKVIANGPMALRLTIEAAVRGSQMTLAEGLNLEATLFGLICTTEDMKEGTRAFLEKRPAAFQNK
jgi:enoyl-CoA hydratase